MIFNFRNTSSSPSELGGVKGKGEGGKGLNLLPFSLSPFPSPHLAFLGWQTTSAVCAVFLLVSVSSFHQSAIANIDKQSQLIAQQSKTQLHPVFKSILPKLKQKTQIKILLPKFIPESDGGNPIYAIIEAATKNNYDILLGFSPDCSGGTACRLGVLSAEAVTRKTPRLTGKTVSLAKGITGYFVDFACGANCSDATLTWRQQGVQYVVGLKAGDRTSLIKMANSAINL